MLTGRAAFQMRGQSSLFSRRYTPDEKVFKHSQRRAGLRVQSEASLPEQPI